MIATVTLNPALDQTVRVDRLVPGTVHRNLHARFDPAGKGINVSLVVRRLGAPTVAFGILAGHTGELILDALQCELVPTLFVRVEGQSRVNLTVIEGGRSTRFVGTGAHATPAALRSVLDSVRAWLPSCRVLVLSGSLPPAAPADTYVPYVRAARECGVPCVLDADGDPMRAALAARPWLIKPNLEEASRLLGVPLHGEDDAISAARSLATSSGACTVLSMGARGSVCVSDGRTWRIHAPRVEPRSQVGSGDAMVAGIAVAKAADKDLTTALALGTAAGAANAAADGTARGDAAHISSLLPLVRIQEVP